jgi:hypothetical protein
MMSYVAYGCNSNKIKPTPKHDCFRVAHQQKGTWLQLPYYALLCLIELIRHNKAVATRFLFADDCRTWLAEVTHEVSQPHGLVGLCPSGYRKPHSPTHCLFGNTHDLSGELA